MVRKSKREEMKFEEFIEEIDLLLSEKKYEEALKRIDEKIKEREDEKLWTVKGSILIKRNEIEKAMKCFDKALEINKKNDIPLALKGLAFYEIDMLNEAEKLFDKSLNERNFTSLYWKGEIERKKGNREREIELKGKAAFILFAIGGDAESMSIFGEVYYSGDDVPIRYECGVAYASMLENVLAIVKDEEREEEYDEIVLDCWKNREKICKSAQILLADMMGEEMEEKIVVNDEKDFVFKDLLEKLLEE